MDGKLISEYNFKENLLTKEYAKFSTKNLEDNFTKKVYKEFNVNELNNGVSNKRMIEFLRGIKPKVSGYKIFRDTDSLGKPYWNFVLCLRGPNKHVDLSSIINNEKPIGVSEKKRRESSQRKVNYNTMPGNYGNGSEKKNEEKRKKLDNYTDWPGTTE